MLNIDKYNNLQIFEEILEVTTNENELFRENLEKKNTLKQLKIDDVKDDFLNIENINLETRIFESDFGKVIWDMEKHIIDIEGAVFSEEELLKRYAVDMPINIYELELKRKFPGMRFISTEFNLRSEVEHA